VPYRRGQTVNLVAKEDVDGLVDQSSDVERGARVSEDLPGSARPGTKLGEIVVKWTGSESGRARSWPACATTRPRCGSECGIQSGGCSRRGVG
jgi:hypothetical protein